MKEKEFLAKLAEVWQCTDAKETANCVEQFFTVLKDGLKANGEVVLPIGKFKLNHKPAGEARVPGTDKKVKTDAKTVVKFQPNKKLKEEFLAVKLPKVKK